MAETKLEVFYKDLQNSIIAELVTEEFGGSSEQIFTHKVVSLLESIGVTENIQICYDRKDSTTKFNHQINAYSISENNETLDLFVTIYKSNETIPQILKSEITSYSKKITNFFTNCISHKYYEQIEETAEVFRLAYELNLNTGITRNIERVNFFVLTNGTYEKQPIENYKVGKYSAYYRIIDLNEYYKITSENDPIIIEFNKDQVKVPCIQSIEVNENSTTYLAILPGLELAKMYDQYGSRLLEQNVRAFLQFTGKINKGIRNTIINEPEMFISYNNGISATASEIEIEETRGNENLITKIKDFQIVNGGQTTASIYYTNRKDKVDISKISVQVKLSIVKNKQEYSNIVSKIAEYANTQNKVSVADLSSNNPFFIQFEKFSRNTYTPDQTKWFFERSRGQYKNARLKEGITPPKTKAFDIKNPKEKVFTKEQLAKYINCYKEVYDKSKLAIGPHIVIKNISNYDHFVKFNITNLVEIDNIFYEDSIAKLIIYKSCESLYGKKPNAIGDLRFITVPYTIAYLGYKTDYKIDLYKIWNYQKVSEKLEKFMYELMCLVDKFLKDNSPESLIEMWARKEKCWNLLKETNFDIDFTRLKNDLENEENPTQRKKLSNEVIDSYEHKENIEKIKSIGIKGWENILEWGESTELLTLKQQNTSKSIIYKLSKEQDLTENEIKNGVSILDFFEIEFPEVIVPFLEE